MISVWVQQRETDRDNDETRKHVPIVIRTCECVSIDFVRAWMQNFF